jgi:sulfofructose kinase
MNAKSPSPKVLCIGIPVRDLIYHIKELPGRGEKVRAESFEEIAGGNALNAGIGIVRLGGRVLLSGPMGDPSETSSQYMFDQLAKEGIETNLARMPGTVTPSSNVMIDPSGERTIVTYRDPRLWGVKLPASDELLRDCAAVLAENRCASFATELCVEASRRNIPVVLDGDVVMSMREGVLSIASHVIFSAEALTQTAGTQDLETALRRRRLPWRIRAGDRGKDGHYRRHALCVRRRRAQMHSPRRGLCSPESGRGGGPAIARNC